VNGNAKFGRAAARSGEWAQHFSNASCIRQSGRHRQRNTDIYIQRNTILGIIKHTVIELAQQIANSFMQWNKKTVLMQ